jgi:hypothetical protein
VTRSAGPTDETACENHPPGARWAASGGLGFAGTRAEPEAHRVGFLRARVAPRQPTTGAWRSRSPDGAAPAELAVAATKDTFGNPPFASAFTQPATLSRRLRRSKRRSNTKIAAVPSSDSRIPIGGRGTRRSAPIGPSFLRRPMIRGGSSAGAWRASSPLHPSSPRLGLAGRCQNATLRCCANAFGRSQ